MKWLNRLEEEHAQLVERMQKLEDFLGVEPNELAVGSEQWRAMQEQLHHMQKYEGVLQHRINMASN